jgi:hypothetical protein
VFDYQRQDAPQSLREGIAEYYRENPGLKRDDELSDAAKDFFRRHDAIHVLYGCDTSLQHEAIVKLSSIFGTTGGFSVLDGYRLHDSIDIYRKLRLSDVLATMLASFVIVPRTIWRCARQARKWPWSDFEAHLDTPLSELRRAFGIRVAQTKERASAASPSACT